MASYVAPGAWRCNFCLRTLPEYEFAVDGYRKRMGKGPGRCQDCDNELARVRQSMSPTGKYSGCVDNSAAYKLAKETCRNHAWGTGYYSRSDKAAALASTAEQRIRGGKSRTAAERRQDEDVRVGQREREQVAEYRELDKRADARTSTERTPTERTDDSDRKRRLREWREHGGEYPLR